MTLMDRRNLDRYNFNKTYSPEVDWRYWLQSTAKTPLQRFIISDQTLPYINQSFWRDKVPAEMRWSTIA